MKMFFLRLKNIFSFPRIFALIILFIIAASLFLMSRSSLAIALNHQQPVFGLLIGTDFVDNARHADTIMLVRYQPTTRSLDLLSIPRDTRIDIPKLKIRKITEVYAYAFRIHQRNHNAAREELTRVLQWVLSGSTVSLDQTDFSLLPKIQYYVQVDYSGFKKIIDLLGGVPVTIDEPMHYDDHWGKLHIHFDPGAYWLDGQKALEYVRYRGSSGDFGRVHRQQMFFLQILSRIKNPMNMIKLPQLLHASLNLTQTNLTWMERILILFELKNLSRNHVRLMQLPGHLKNGYWMPEADSIEITQRLLNETDSVHKENSQQIQQTENLQTPIRSKTTVEVWNASGKSGLAVSVMRKLRKAGFDVVKWGNYSSHQKRTLVRDRKGNTQQAQAIVDALNSISIEMVTRIESNPLVDVEVILGQDCEE